MVTRANIVHNIVKQKVMYHDNHKLISLLLLNDAIDMWHVFAGEDSKF